MLEPDVVLPSEQRKLVERELFLRAMSPAKPPPEAARQLAQILRDVHLPAGAVIFRRGDEPVKSYYVVSGQVTLEGLEGDDIEFGPGAIIGILDLNIGRPRIRTAVVTKPAHVLEMPYDGWMEVLEDFPDFTSSARRAVARGLHEIMLTMAPTGGFEHIRRRADPLPDTDVVSRIIALRRVRSFERCSVQALAELASRAEVLELEAGEMLMRPGSGNERIFVVMRGSVHVERRVAPELAATFYPGELVLGSATFAGALPGYASVAGANTALLAIDQSEIDDVADDHFDLVKAVLRGMSIERDTLATVRARAAASRRGGG
ncbi:MAG: cyclic nucleotide-binding domain-containing protein [Polyangiaceae bacterium]|nr:cyclic nucleotide-binding domain-containing protein [Polyangiaceae bacterium]